jgi:hypothetical protein
MSINVKFFLADFSQVWGSNPTFLQVTQSDSYFAALKPAIHGLALVEIFGNKEGTCGVYSIDGSIEGGHPTTFKAPFDLYSVVLEGSSW